jgi:uncharacterized membrane protein YagU involved in acid resistance
MLATALIAGLTGAIVEMVFVLPIQAFALGHSPELVFQSIAMGALGRAAFTGGLASALLGAAVHGLISVVAAGVYVLAAVRWPVLVRRPVAGGIIFGALVYGVMTFVVIPLSAIGFQAPKSPGLALLSLSIHLIAFGLPIALVVRAMAGRAPDRTLPSP